MFKTLRKSILGPSKPRQFHIDQDAIEEENIQGKRTLTIYMHIHSEDKLDAPPLRITPNMAKHIAISEANRVGICNFSRGHSTLDEFKFVNNIRRTYATHKDNAMEGNSEYFDKYVDVTQFRIASRNPYLLTTYNVDQETFTKVIYPEYNQRVLWNNPGKANRVYHTNKEWSTTINPTEKANYVMGAYIVGIHHCPPSLEKRLRDTYYDYDAYSHWPRIPPSPHHIPTEFFSMFKHLQCLNLMNVEVSERLSKALGIKEVNFGTNESSSITGINRYSRTNLERVLTYVKDLGFEYANIVDSGCRFTDIDYKNPEVVARTLPLLRQQSEKETDDFERIRETEAFLPKHKSRTFKRKSRKLNIHHR